MIGQTIYRQDSEGEDFELGERLLYLRTPNFRGRDVEELQSALGALGFATGGVTGTFGAYTEGALRKFQLNMGLVPDGIAGVKTYAVIKNLHNAWMDKPQIEDRAYMGFARAADVLERHAACLFGTDEFSRKVASYMSNLALATNPRSKMVSAETLLVPPDESMLLTHIVRKGASSFDKGVPRVVCDDMAVLPRRISSAMERARATAQGGRPLRIEVEVAGPAQGADEAGIDQLAHHEAIMLLDAFCAAFSGHMPISRVGDVNAL